MLTFMAINSDFTYSIEFSKATNVSDDKFCNEFTSSNCLVLICRAPINSSSSSTLAPRSFASSEDEFPALT